MIGRVILVAVLMVLADDVAIHAQQTQRQRRVQRPSATRVVDSEAEDSILTGVYRLDPESSDRLYSAVAGASSRVPFERQQRFLIDLTIRHKPPDLIAIERRGSHISIGSSRAPRITFQADGTVHTERIAGGQVLRSRALLDAHQLSVTSNGNNTIDRFAVTFRALDNGRRLRVTRRIHAEQLLEAIDVQSVYNKVSDIAQWSIYGEEQPLPIDPTTAAAKIETPSVKLERNQANTLRSALDNWIAATNAGNIEGQMSFYQPIVEAFYLARNVSVSAVRAEKVRVFSKADVIDVQAAEPEIIFRDAGRSAIMRFRKKYRIERGLRSRRGEVIQELRWRQSTEGWKIFSERDVRVIR